MASVRGDIIGCGAVLHLAALGSDPLAPAGVKKGAQKALDRLCPSKEAWQDAVGESVAAVWPAVRAQTAAFDRLRALADGAGSTSRAHCDVTLRCANGEELGASRFLLAHTSSYYRSLFDSGSAEAASGVVMADPDFSAEAHAALLRQLHSLGEAPLPEDAGVVLELLKLAAKLEPPAGSSAEQAAPGPLLQLVIARCETAVLSGLDVSNCLDMLLHVKANGSFPRIVEAAEALVKDQVRDLCAHPRWAKFRAENPQDALDLMQAVAIRLSRHHDDGGPSDHQSSAKRRRLG